MSILRKIIPYLFLLISIFLVSIIWEYINFPFNSEKNIPGQHYLKNLHNPLNDSVRFIVFISLPLIIFFIMKLVTENRQLKIFYNDLFIRFDNSSTRIINNKDINFFFKLIFVSLIIQFLCLDFKQYVYQLDTFHEGLWLTASSNAIYTNELWQSSYVGRGLFGNFYNYFIWKVTGINSIGMSRFVTLFFMLCNKIFLILISKNLVEKTLLNNCQKFFLFIALSFLLINFSNYGESNIFYLRSFGLLFFLYYLLKFFDSFKKSSLSLTIIGFFSSISFFWYIDIGAFVNLTIFFLIIYLLLRKEFGIITSLFFYILIGWLMFYTFMPKNEFNEFYKNTLSIFSTIEYIQGLIYPTPFFSGDARSTRALLLILITGALTTNLLFKKDNEISIETKLALIFLFLIACINFKTALSRSDTGHIKHGLSILYIPFFYYILYFLISKLNFKKCLKKIKLTNNNFQILFLILFFILSVFGNKNVDIKNLPKSFVSIKFLINQSDDMYLNQDHIEFIDFFKRISKNDKCVQNFTNETAIPYLLKKPTCSKYYFLYTSSSQDLQKDHVSSLILNKPEYVLYEYSADIYGDPRKRLTVVNDFILNHYTFFEKFKKWTILKIK